MEGYTTVKQGATFEFEDRKSVFIADVLPVSTESEALAFVDSVRKRYPDAKHHVYAYVLRENSIMRFSDDREPQGTAGLPVLDCIRKGGYVDVAIVVTRYFGGVLLGTGGLVHAYTAAAQGAIKSAGDAKYDLYRRIEITVSYSDYQKITTAISESGFRVSNTFYKEDVVIEGSILSVNSATLCASLVQLTAARVICKVGEEIFDC